MVYQKICHRCNGKGYVEVCEKCHGLGIISEIKLSKNITTYTTKKCDCGAKIIIENKCSSCNGKGYMWESASSKYPKEYPIELIPIGAHHD